jgi:glutamate dehydrogenase/leucine dehydrogenase
MEFHKLTSTDAFIVFDLDDAPALGVVRQAPKVLKDGAELLARSTTYTAASFGLQVGGGSAGINAKADDRDAALAAFLEEVAPLVESGRWLPGPGVGIAADDLAGLPRADDRTVAFDQTAAGESAVAAALGALGSLDGKQVAIVGNGPITEAAAASASANGATPQPQASFDAECDALLVAGKAGVLEHDLAATVRASVVVPLTPVPVTARALAVLGRAGVVVVPDFLSTAAPTLTAVDPDGDDPMLRVHDAVASLAAEGTDLWVAAVAKAEEHLGTWQDALPFGRPLA